MTGCRAKPNWADEVEELEPEDADELPPSTTVGPDANGVVTTTEYYIDDDGKKVKLVRRVRVKKVRHTVYKAVAVRKHWAKFGQAYGMKPGPDPATTNVGESIPLKLSVKINTVEQEEEPSSTFDVLKKKDKMVVCRICKGDHWTLKCPYKDTLGSLTEMGGAAGDDGAAASASKDDMAAGGGGAGGASATGKYVPPSMRGGAGDGKRRGESMGGPRGGRGDDAATLRVTNVSEDTQEADLMELFRPFGRVERVYVGRDKITNAAKGFAFVSFMMKEEAMRAKNALDGYGYDNLILHVEFSQPRGD